ncbi:tetratricopeptide repeat protein [Cytophagaceae bacterium YF14B1]|uniref:Tetratricopeptide repeat protein n=1 Tax=Xanthocytophaga flava TaxID=3048013 RepID=A0AAE3U5D2_9BACT|nr:tetratricopeptide repeat protein [Xanthocytophaga flavus]MDJ1480136.1 tetratricopeptide repeat protein [Xanthocytophaga flavus]
MSIWHFFIRHGWDALVLSGMITNFVVGYILYVMKKSQIISIVIAVFAIGVLYSLPKVIVSDKDKKIDRKPTEQQVEAVTTESSHNQSLSAEQASVIKNLTNQYKNSTDKEKKIIFADSLAGIYRKAMIFDSVAVYRELIVGLEPSEKNLLSAADACYDAFFFVTDAGKVEIYGEKARGYYQKVLDRNPKQLNAKAKMAVTYANSASPMQAIAMLREVIAEDPKNEQALFNLGLLSIRSGQYDKAVERFKEVLKNNPVNLQAKLYLGISYAELGDKASARQFLEEAKSGTDDVMILNAADEYLKELEAAK